MSRTDASRTSKSRRVAITSRVTGPRGRPLLVDHDLTTWELRRDAQGGADWFVLPTIGAPPVMVSQGIMYDPARDQVLLTGMSNSELQLWSLTFVSPQPRETCVLGEDRDGDGARACGDATYPADPDCWAICDPVCSPHETVECDPARMRCGDGACSAIENYRTCPADCPGP